MVCYIKFECQDYIQFREDETPYSWQEAYDEAIANGTRMPTKTELLSYLSTNNNQPLYNEDIWVWVVANNAILNIYYSKHSQYQL